jgi:acetolactate synthase-1/2/3 large subunit
MTSRVIMKMGKISGAKMVGKALKNENVKYLFALCGGNVPIFDACLDEEIKVIDARHEQAAVNMAHAWALLTGEVGVCSAQEAPGVANMFPAIQHAWLERVPIVILVTSTPLSSTEKLEFHEFNAIDVVKPMTKWCLRTPYTPRLAEYMNQAFREAASGRPGPVLLDFPRDILISLVDEASSDVEIGLTPHGHRTKTRPYGDPVMIRKALDMLLKAERPLIIVGWGAVTAQEEILKFAELTKIPIIPNGPMGFIASDNPLSAFCGAITGIEKGLYGQIDVIMLVGNRINDWIGYCLPPVFDEKVKVIQVDIHPEEIGRNRPIDVGIVGDSKSVMSQFIEMAKEALKKPRGKYAWLQEIEKIKKEAQQSRLEEALAEGSELILPQRLRKEVNEILTPDTVFLADGGDSSFWSIDYIKSFGKVRKYIICPGTHSGHLGACVPFAISAKLAYPEDKVLCITGDGSFLFNAVELDTARRHNTPFVIVVDNNCAWGMVLVGQEMVYGRTVGTKLSPATRYDKLAQAFDCYGELVTDPTEIKPAIKRAFDSGLPAVIDVRTKCVAHPVDYITSATENPEALSFKYV